MTDEPTTPPTEEPPTEEPAPEAPPTEDPATTAPAADEPEDDTDDDDKVDDWRERRLKWPRVQMLVSLPMDDETWATRGSDYVSRPDVEVEARRMPTNFVFETPDFRTMDGLRGDWLIRERESGHVFALTDRAFKMLYESAHESPEVPSA